MSEFSNNQFQDVRIMIVADVDIRSANFLAEKFVPQEPIYDCIVCCGPFVNTKLEELSTEEESIIRGDMASILASFENIVCRVIYLPHQFDRVTSTGQEIHLTPNSINIHARRMGLMKGLFISGYSEAGDNLSHKVINHNNAEDECYSDDEYDGLEVQSNTGSIKIIGEVLLNGVESRNEATKQILQTGIFVLNYKFTHTLNHFLFHMPEKLESAGVSLVIMNSFGSTIDSIKLPKMFGNMHIVVPPSLKNQGKYIDAVLSYNENEKKWNVTSIEIV